MDIEHFEALCDYEPGEAHALRIDPCGVRVDLLHSPESWHLGRIVVLFEVGPLQGRELQARTLMETLVAAGFTSWRLDDMPMLGVHPDTGAAVLQCTHALLDPEPGALAALIHDGAALAIELREDLLVSS